MSKSTPKEPTTRSLPSLRLSRRRFLQGSAALGLAAAAPIGLANPARAQGTLARNLRIADRGQTHYSIYLGADEDAVVQQAATELSSYLQQITGATFPVVAAATPPAGDQLLVVGQNNPVAAGFSVDYSTLGDDGFAMRTNGLIVLIAGASSRGTLYGVYWALDRVFGVRWFAADYTLVPTDPSLLVADAALNGDQVPRFRYRQMLAGDATDPVYRQHNLLNGTRQQGPAQVPAGLDTWSDYWPAESFGGTFHTMVPDQTLWAGGQLACMNPQTRELAATNLVAAINARIAAGEDPTYGFEQQDADWTPDADSQAFADAHGGALSAPMLDMVNDVFGRVRQQIPQARLSTQAYEFSFAAPTGVAADPDLVMTVAPIRADFGHSLLGPQNQDIADNLTAWCALSPNVVLWDYLTTFASYIQPFPNWYLAGESLQALAQHPGAQGYMGEGAYNTIGAEFANLRVWVMARLLWDPSQDVDSLILEFLNGYYGAAAADLHSYLQVMVASFEQTGQKLTDNVTLSAAYLTFDAMRQADSLLADAENAVADDPVLAKHVRNVRLGVDFIILIRSGEFEGTAQKEGVDWDLDIDNRITRFDTELDESGLTHNTESGVTPADLKAMVLIRRTPATPPQAVAGLPDSDWIDFQDPVMRLYAPVTTLVEDDLASDHYTVEMPGNRSDWGVQLPLSQLPTGSDWTLYVTVRVDPGTAAASATAFDAGVYPASDPDVKPTIGEFSDGQYHEIAIPGLYQYDDTGRYAHIAPPNSPDVTAIYVDRLFAVKT